MANSNEILEIIDDIFSNENNNKLYGITSLINVNDLLDYAQNYDGSQEKRERLIKECAAKKYKFSDKELIDIVKKYYDLFNYKKIILVAGGIVNRHLEDPRYKDNPDALLELRFLRDYIYKLAKKYINPNEKVQVYDVDLRKGALNVIDASNLFYGIEPDLTCPIDDKTYESIVEYISSEVNSNNEIVPAYSCFINIADDMDLGIKATDLVRYAEQRNPNMSDDEKASIIQELLELPEFKQGINKNNTFFMATFNASDVLNTISDPNMTEDEIQLAYTILDDLDILYNNVDGDFEVKDNVIPLKRLVGALNEARGRFKNAIKVNGSTNDLIELVKRGLLMHDDVIDVLDRVNSPNQLLAEAYVNNLFGLEDLKAVEEKYKDRDVSVDVIKSLALKEIVGKEVVEDDKLDKFPIDNRTFDLLPSELKTKLLVNRLNSGKFKDLELFIQKNELSADEIKQLLFERRVALDDIENFKKYVVDNKVKYDLSELEYSPEKLGGCFFELRHDVFAKASEDLGIILEEPDLSDEEIEKRKVEYNFQKLLYQRGKKYLSEDEVKEYQKEIGKRLDSVEDGLSTLLDSDIVLEQLYLDELIGFEQLKYPELKEKLLKEHKIRPIDLSYFPETSKEKKGPIDNLSLLSTYYYQGTLTSSQLIDFYINNQISANTFNQMAEAIHLEMEFDKIFDEEKLKKLGYSALTNIGKDEITSKFARYHDIALRYSKNPQIEDVIYKALEKTKAKKQITAHNIENLYKAKLLSPKDIEKLGTKYWGILLNSKRFNVRPTDLKIAFRDMDGKVEKRNKLEELFLNEFNTNNAKTPEEKENLFEIRKNLLEQIYLNSDYLQADDDNYRFFVTNGYIEFDEAEREAMSSRRNYC